MITLKAIPGNPENVFFLDCEIFNMTIIVKELERFSNRTCGSCKTQPFYLLKWVWAKLNTLCELRSWS